jgi:hypothetical protein
VTQKKEVKAPIIIDPISTTTNPIIGGDKDEHGCLGPAGYSWCAVKNKCLRVWEEKCEITPVVPPISTSTDFIVCTMDAKQCSDGSWVGRSGPKCEFVCPSVTSKCAEGDVKKYTCPNGDKVNWCGCNDEGVFTCIISPETKCN